MNRTHLAATISMLLCASACTGHHGKSRTVVTPVASPQGLTASGFGEAKAPPDVARASIGVEMRADSAEQALAAANERMTAVLGALKAAGITDKDLRTTGFSVEFERDPTPPQPYPQSELAPARGKSAAAASPAPQPPQVRGVYRVLNMVEATMRDLDRVGQTVAAATAAGANQIWGVSFELQDPAVLASQARAKAFEHAKRNAADMARLAGVELGPLVAVSEGESHGGAMPRMSSMRAEAAQASDVPIERGELLVSHTVQLVYALP
jgi:uncharacterized protein